jgi:hypothetical protein
MDTTDTSQLETDPDDYWGKAHRQRSSAERDRFRDFYGVSEMLDGNENAWDVVERRERLAQAIYET